MCEFDVRRRRWPSHLSEFDVLERRDADARWQPAQARQPAKDVGRLEVLGHRPATARECTERLAIEVRRDEVDLIQLDPTALLPPLQKSDRRVAHLEGGQGHQAYSDMYTMMYSVHAQTLLQALHRATCATRIGCAAADS